MASLKSLLGLSSSNYQILYGIVAIKSSSGVGNATFSPPFKSTPVVAATAYYARSASDVSAWITSVDETSVSIKCPNGSNIHWIAIGEPS